MKRSAKLKSFMVICFDEDSRQINSFAAKAARGLEAFYAVAQEHPNRDLTFVVAVEGTHAATARLLTYPGEGLVSAETVLEQPDVFAAD